MEENDIRGAQHILLNITSGTREVTMDEIFEITEFVQEEAGYGTDLIWGNCFDESLGDKISVTVIATGFEHSHNNKVSLEDNKEKIVVSLEDDNPTKKNGLYDLGHTEEENAEAETFEFDDIRSSIAKYSKGKYSYDEPYIKSEDKEKMEEERKKRMEIEARRRERLRNVSVKLNNPQNIVELENEPAYLRRNVELDDVPHSSTNESSKWSISEGDDPELRDNSFLHDNVD